MANELITDELIAAYLDGNTSPAETQLILQAIATNPAVKEVFGIAQKIHPSENRDVIPMMRQAADGEENLCAFLCELYILQKHDILFDENQLLCFARQNNWLRHNGTPLHSMGNLLSKENLLVVRQYDSSIREIAHILSSGGDVIAVVDSDKLYSKHPDYEDEPNHAVVVTVVSDKCITVFDPMVGKEVKVLFDDFLRAWDESQRYIVGVLSSIDQYEPHPLNLEEVPLTDDLQELQEAIAENAHEVWAAARKSEGWTYGPVRSDALKQHPDLIPYSALPDTEKEYDRLMALNTIKLVKKLGFGIRKCKF